MAQLGHEGADRCGGNAKLYLALGLGFAAGAFFLAWDERELFLAILTASSATTAIIAAMKVGAPLAFLLYQMGWFFRKMDYWRKEQIRRLDWFDFDTELPPRAESDTATGQTAHDALSVVPRILEAVVSRIMPAENRASKLQQRKPQSEEAEIINAGT
jgi:hypothetical protein